MKKIFLVLLTLTLSTNPVLASSDSATIDLPAKMISSDDSTRTISESDENPIAQDKVTKKKKKNVLRLVLRTGALYDNNIYTYSRGYIDTFGLNPLALGAHPWRFPGVKSTADAVFPMGARLTLSMGHFSVRAGISGELYRLNSQMNNGGGALQLGWNGPVSVSVEYQLKPYCPIRPSSLIPYQYELMRYREDKGILAAQLNIWKIKPFADIALGYENYNTTFDVYDASFYEGGLGVAMTKPLNIRVRCEAGVLSAKPHTNQDMSRTFGGADFDIHYPLRAWILGTKGSVLDKIYTTRDSLDKHTDRKDFEGNACLYVKHTWRSLGAAATTGYSWRNTTSPITKVAMRKTYGEFRAGIDFSWDFRKKF
jgi:hypothetical protein